MNVDKAILLIQQALTELGPPTAPPPPAQHVVVVKPGEVIQSAIDAAPDNTLIRIQPGKYACNLVIPAGKTGLTLQTDMADPTLIPPVPWVTPAMFGLKAAILVPQDPASPVISAAPGAHDCLLQLLEVGPNLVLPDRGLIDLGDLNQATFDAVPYNIHVDRCYVHGSPEKGAHRGVMLNTRNSRVTRCYISDCWERGRDSQALAAFTGPGPYYIGSNYLEGSGENVMIGGVDPKITGLIPSDILVEGNYCFKPLAWKTLGLTPAQIAAGVPSGCVKNLFELKNARRVILRQNVFENSWIDAQSGHGVVFTVRDQDGMAPWTSISDVLVQGNVIRHVQGSAFNILGLDDIPGRASVQALGLTLDQNLIVDAGNGLQTSSGFRPTTLTHNTFAQIRHALAVLYAPAFPAGQLILSDNVLTGGEYGVFGDNVGSGTPAFVAYAPAPVLARNVLDANVLFPLYPPGITVIPTGTLAAKLDPQFRYLGSERALDGLRIGANVDAILTALPWLTL